MFNENHKLWVTLNQFYSSETFETIKDDRRRRALIQKLKGNSGFALCDALLPSVSRMKEILKDKPIFVPPGRKGKTRPERDTYICPYSSCFYTSKGGKKGWNSFYFPWFGDPMIRFVAEKVLGIDQPDIMNPQDRSANTLQFSDEEEEEEEDNDDKGHRMRGYFDSFKSNDREEEEGEGGEGGNSGKSIRTRIARALIKEFSTGGRNGNTLSVNGINTNIMPLMDEELLESALRHVNKRKNADRYTKITPEDVAEVLKKITTYAPIDQDLTNSLVYLKNKTEAVKKLILKDKPSLEEICSSNANSLTLNDADMGTSMSSSWFDKDGKPNAFTKSFYRFCELKSNLAHRITGEFENVICCESILTKGMKAVNDYRKANLLGKWDSRAARHDLAMSTFDNVLERMALMVKVDQHVAHATQYWFLVFFSILDASRYAFALHLNLLNTGQFASSKSYTCNACIRCCIPGTVQMMDDFTARAFAVGEDCGDLTYYSDEMQADLANSGADESNAKAVMIKKMLTEGYILLLLFTWVDMPNGMQRERGQLSIRCNCSSTWVCCANKSNLPESLLSRFCRLMWAKDSNAVKDVINRARGKVYADLPEPKEESKIFLSNATLDGPMKCSSSSYSGLGMMAGMLCGSAAAAATFSSEKASEKPPISKETYEKVETAISCGKSLQKHVMVLKEMGQTEKTSGSRPSSQKGSRTASPSSSTPKNDKQQQQQQKPTSGYGEKIDKRAKIVRAASDRNSHSSASSSSSCSVSREPTPVRKTSKRLPDHSDLHFPGNASQQNAEKTSYRKSNASRTLIRQKSGNNNNNNRDALGVGSKGRQHRPKTKEADAKESRELSSANVIQNMFLEDMGGAENNPYASNTEEDNLSKKTRTIQALQSLAFKLIHLGALPEVNMSVGHLVALKFFSLLKKKTGFSLNNFRIYERIIIVARLRTIWSGNEELFTSESSELGAIVAEEGLKVPMMLRLTPYLVCQWNDIVFAITLLTAEFINPFQSVIITVLGNTLCGYKAKRTQNEFLRKTMNEYCEERRKDWTKRMEDRLRSLRNLTTTAGKNKHEQREIEDKRKKLLEENAKNQCLSDYVLNWRKDKGIRSGGGSTAAPVLNDDDPELKQRIKERKDQLLKFLALHSWLETRQQRKCTLSELCYNLIWIRKKQEKALDKIPKKDNIVEEKRSAEETPAFRTESEKKNAKETKTSRKKYFLWKTSKARKIISKIDYHLPPLTEHQIGELIKRNEEKRARVASSKSLPITADTLKRDDEFILDRLLYWIYDPHALISTNIRSQAEKVVAATNAAAAASTAAKDRRSVVVMMNAKTKPVAPPVPKLPTPSERLRPSTVGQGPTPSVIRGRERGLDPNRLPEGRHSSSSESASEGFTRNNNNNNNNNKDAYVEEDIEDEEQSLLSSLTNLAIDQRREEEEEEDDDVQIENFEEEEEEERIIDKANDASKKIKTPKPLEGLSMLLCGYLSGEMMPHEVFLTFDTCRTEGGISWAKGKVGQSSGGGGYFSTAEDGRNSSSSSFQNAPAPNEFVRKEQYQNNNNNNNKKGSGGNDFSSSTSDQVDGYDLNYVERNTKLGDLAGEIWRCMNGAGPSHADIQQILIKLKDQTIEVENAYARPLSMEEIRNLGSMTIEEAIKEGYMVAKKTMPILIIDGGYKTDGGQGRILISTHSVNASVDLKKLITEILTEMVYKGMKPGRTTLGMMGNADRGHFDWFDVTDEMIASSPRDCFSVDTGGSLSDREHNIISYVYDFANPINGPSDNPRNKKNNKATRLGQIREDMADRARMDEEWGEQVSKNLKKTAVGYPSNWDGMVSLGRESCARELHDLEMRLLRSLDFEEGPQVDEEFDAPIDLQQQQREHGKDKEDKEYAQKLNSARNKSLKNSTFTIYEDINLWGVKRHFINCGILVTIDPADGSLKWLFIDYKESKKIAKMSEEERKNYVPMVEYRHFPTTFNQRMRSIASFAINHPRELERQNQLFHIDLTEVQRAARFFFGDVLYDRVSSANEDEDLETPAPAATTPISPPFS